MHVSPSLRNMPAALATRRPSVYRVGFGANGKHQMPMQSRSIPVTCIANLNLADRVTLAPDVNAADAITSRTHSDTTCWRWK